MSERTYLSMHAKLYLYIISLFLETMRTKFFERKINWNNRKEGKKKPVRKEMTNPMSGVRVSMGNGDVGIIEGGNLPMWLTKEKSSQRQSQEPINGIRNKAAPIKVFLDSYWAMFDNSLSSSLLRIAPPNIVKISGGLHSTRRAIPYFLRTTCTNMSGFCWGTS